MNKQWLTSAAILAIVIAVGCSEKPQRSDLTGSRSGGLPLATTFPNPVTVTIVDRAGYDAAIAKLRGKVVLVDFWATWCLPCVEQLPHTLELGRRLGDRGLVVVTVSCDELKESDSLAKILATHNADGATNLMSKFGGSSTTMETFEIDGGAVPFYKLYDRKGELRQSFGGTASGEIDPAVDQLLGE
jgi:thiol-disulfide isomerase/thioredoxin